MNIRVATVSLAAASLLLTGCGGDADAADADGATDAVASAEGVVEVEAGDLYFEPEALSATAGETEFRLVNTGAVYHDLVVEEAGDVQVAEAEGGETATGTLELEPGTYTLYCSVPGHRSSMEATLTVD